MPADVATSKKKEAVNQDASVLAKTTPKKEKPVRKPKKTAAAAEPEERQEEEEAGVPSENEEVQEELDIETQALVKALDSGDDDATKTEQVSTYKKGQEVGKAPKPKKGGKAFREGVASGQAGVMYLGSIPHGFYEHEIREYFSQFGEITRLRVVRNKKTGASRHRAFIEFADVEVADIAARTMDNYLLFGHILRARLVPPSDVHPELFKGCNRRFKAVPWNEMAGRHLERPLAESKWQGRIAKEEQRRAARAEKLKDLGYEFEAPKLKAAEAKMQPPQLEGGDEEAVKVVEEAEVVAEIDLKKDDEVVVEKTKTVVSISQKSKTKKAPKVKKAKS